MPMVRNPASGLDHGPVVHNHRKRAGKLSCDGHGKVVATPGYKGDFDPASGGLGNSFPVDLRNLRPVVEQSAIDIERNEPNWHVAILPYPSAFQTYPRSTGVLPWHCPYGSGSNSL